jgi:hypothetical protein
MTVSNPEQAPAPQPRRSGVKTDYPNAIDIYDDSEGDHTVRPVRSPDLLRVRPLQRPSAEEPPEKEDKCPGETGPNDEAAGS